MAGVRAGAHRARFGDRAGVEQELLREGGLTGVRVGDDGEGATARDLFGERAHVSQSSVYEI